jgi:cell division protein FtsQ
MSVLVVLEENEVVLDSIDDIGAGGVEGTVAGRSVLFSREVESLQAQALKSLMNKYPDAPYFDLRSPNRVVVGTGLGSHSIQVSDG